MRGPATISDAIVRGGASTFEQRDGYAVVETPARRDFWFGNMLVLDAAPSPDEYAAWLSLCARTFAERGVRRYVVQWETAGSADDLTAVASERRTPSQRRLVLPGVVALRAGFVRDSRARE
jgi:hypothetical protein